MTSRAVPRRARQTRGPHVVDASRLARAIAVVLPLALALAAFVAFVPALDNGFVDWDDDSNFLDNARYRGLGWAQLQWMFSSTLNGLYIPVTWMTLGLDYALWGMNPFGYHLTSVLLHALNTALFYLVARRLLTLTVPLGATEERWGPVLGAAAAALLFGLHPLRAESVAWVTERRDVVSGLFHLLAVAAYLRYGTSPATTSGRRWYWASLGAFVLALLGKPMAVTLPLVLLVLDVYPLRRLRGVRDILDAQGRRVWLEKIPFLLPSLIVSAVTASAGMRIGHLVSVSTVSLLDRIAISAYGLAFYLWKTVVPLELLPLYELPPRLDPTRWPFLVAAAVVLIATGIGVATWRRWPWLGALWAVYVVSLLPVVGLVQNGPQIAADRYTYLACGGWAVLAGAGVSLTWVGWRRRQLGAGVAIAVGGVTMTVVVLLGTLTWSQVQVWRDSQTLWTHVVGRSPSAIAHFKLGVRLAHGGEFASATARFREALRINPGYARAHAALGFALAFQERFPEATEHFREALRLDPRETEAHGGLGLALERQGRLGDAAYHLREALRANPDDANARRNLTLVLRRQGNSYGGASTAPP